MQASLLPDEDDPIVPIDRSFVGGPSSGILHQTEALEFKRACSTIDKPRYVRLVKLDIKLRLVKQVIGWLFAALIVAEMVALVGWSASPVFLKIALGVPIAQEEVDDTVGIARDILSRLIGNAHIYPQLDIKALLRKEATERWM